MSDPTPTSRRASAGLTPASRGSSCATEGKPDKVDKKNGSRRISSLRLTGVNWDDPNVPAGNAPPLPRWPMVIAGFAWFAWIVFLVVLLV